MDPGHKVVYLTFDDGPGPYTADLLDLLARYNIKVTFFVTNMSPGYRELMKRGAAEGHTIGIHAYNHGEGVYVSEEVYFEDFNTIRDIIIEQTGIAPTIMRFPYGSSNSVSKFNPGIMTRLTKLVQEMGYQYFDWNVSTGDGSSSITADQAYNFAVTGMQSHDISVILMHDQNPASMQAVERIINWGLANGYTFLPLTKDSPVCHHTVYN